MSEPVWGVLTRAADHLEGEAADAVPGPWRAYPDHGLWSVGASGGQAVCTDAEPSQEWLRQTAHEMEAERPKMAEGWWRMRIEGRWGAPLRLARGVLGEEQP